MIAFGLFTVDHNHDSVFTFSDFFYLLQTVFCLPANLLIEFLSTRESLRTAIAWTTAPESMMNGWAAACGSMVIWLLLVAFVSSFYE